MNKVAVQSSNSRDIAEVGDKINSGFLEELIGYQLRRAQTALFQDFSLALGEKQITPGQFGLLVKIKHNQGISQTGLAKAVGVERSTLGETIDRFEKETWWNDESMRLIAEPMRCFLPRRGNNFYSPSCLSCSITKRELLGSSPHKRKRIF